jgi:hypothetical protein
MVSKSISNSLRKIFLSKTRIRSSKSLKEQRRSILVERLESREVFASGDLLISEFVANPAGTDGAQEYVELIATKAINFATTPYSVVFANNGVATTNGWIAGAGLTYAFNITSGTVAPGDVVYVGGSAMAPTGTKSRVIDVTTTAGDGGIGNGITSGGVLGNGGANADGIAVFDLPIASVTSSTVPIDAILFGTGVGTAVFSGAGGYQLPVNDNYVAGGKVAAGSFLAPEPSTSGVPTIATGTYNTLTANFSTPRTWANTAATATSEITLAGTAGPEINVVGNSLGIADGDTTPNLADHTVFLGTVVSNTSSRTYTIQNTGSAALTLGTFTSSNAVFALSGPLPSSVAPSGSVNITVNFTPTTTGVATSTISFVNNDASENPFDFVVSGFGASAISSSVAINELRMRDSVNDAVSNNFVELYQTSGASNNLLSGLTLLVVSTEFNPGLINFAVDLSTAVTDANGFVLIADDGTTATTGAGDVILTSFNLFNTPAAYLVVSGFSGASGADLDLDNVGGFDTTPWTSIIDSVALDRSTNLAQDYSPTEVLGVLPDTETPAGVYRFANGTGTYGALSFTSTARDTPGFSNILPPGVSIVQSGGSTNVAEGGATDTFDVALNAEPTSNVTVTFTISDGQTTVSSGSLTFTPSAGANPWNVAQTITVTAVDDSFNEALHSGSIAISTTSSQASYNALVVPPVSVSISDNDGAALTQIVLNEIYSDPQGADTGNEYIEFRGTPGANIPSNYYLVEIEGDSATTGTGSGAIDHVFSLGGMTIGLNGFLVLRQFGSSYTTSPGSAVVTATGSGWGTTFSNTATDLENGSASYLLITSATAPTPGADIDASGTGAIDSALGWTIVDSIGILDGGATDNGYAATNFSTGTAGIVLTPNTIFDLATSNPPLTTGFRPEYLGRNGNTTGNAAVDWVAADTNGTAPTFTLATNVYPAALSGIGSLNHLGSTNVFAPTTVAPKV